MTTKELIELLKKVDPKGIKEVGIEPADGSGRATHLRIDAPAFADWITLAENG